MLDRRMDMGIVTRILMIMSTEPGSKTTHEEAPFSPPYFQGGVAPQVTGWLPEVPLRQPQPPHPFGAPLLENKEGRVLGISSFAIRRN